MFNKTLRISMLFGAFIILIDQYLLFNFLWHIRSTDDAYQNRTLFHQICLMVSDHYYTLILLRRIIAQTPKFQFYLKDFHNKNSDKSFNKIYFHRLIFAISKQREITHTSLGFLRLNKHIMSSRVYTTKRTWCHFANNTNTNLNTK